MVLPFPVACSAPNYGLATVDPLDAGPGLAPGRLPDREPDRGAQHDAGRPRRPDEAAPRRYRRLTRVHVRYRTR